MFMYYPLTEKLFPMSYKIVSSFLEGVTVRWKDIARELGLSEQTIDRINNTHQGNPEFCCKQMIEESLIGKEVKMNWQSLTEALRKLHMKDLVDMICEHWGKLMEISWTTFHLNLLCYRPSCTSSDNAA